MFKHLVFEERIKAVTAKIVSDAVMKRIPKLRTWKQIQKWMKFNHWLMSKYGYWSEDGYKEF